jgi:1-acyl-sn-glycerol-3-phosphate acyltransferase
MNNPLVFYNFYTHKLRNRIAAALFIFLMNLILLMLLVGWTFLGIVLFPLAFLFMKYIQGWSAQCLTRKCIWVYGRVWQFITGFFVAFDPPLLDPDQFHNPGIIVVNHRSFLDTYCMNMLPVSNICFAVRNWPFKIPLYSLFMALAGYLNVEKIPWEKFVSISKQIINNKGFILFFPEGHRSRTKDLTHFYSGAFKLAVETNSPVIPVCLTGTQNLLPRGRHYLTPARIKMKVLDPVFPDQFQGEMKHQKLKKLVKQQMDEQLTKMDDTVAIFHEKTLF